MKKRLCFPALLVVLLAPAMVPDVGQAQIDQGILALHWHPATAGEARRRTLAAAAWLREDPAESTEWEDAVNAYRVTLERSARGLGPGSAQPADGFFAWLVQIRERNLDQAPGLIPEPDISDISELLQQPGSAGRIARLERTAALRAPVIWQQLADRLEAAGVEEPGKRIVEFWRPLRGTLEAENHPERWQEHARMQSDRVVELRDADSEQRIMHQLVFDQARFFWEQGRVMNALWLVVEGLARLSQLDDINEEVAAYRAWFDDIGADERRDLRRVDIDLPVVLALLEDAAEYLAGENAGTIPALVELGDAYARLALFAPDMAFYIDQPVRSDIREALGSCNPDPLLVGPLPREVFERCVNNLLGLLEDSLDSEELTGGRQGPFAPEFLRREMGLISWQRAAYLDGHLAWMLEAPCEPPQWFNVLEWSLLIEHLTRWVEQRPVFFVSPHWQEALAALEERVTDQSLIHADWIDCLTGHGSERRDPVVRLLDRQELALKQIGQALDSADQAFYEEVTRPGADIALDGPADQTTGYRPQELTVGPCPEARTCGTTVELPASRALLSLFPNAFLLADQIEMGSLDMCYENVHWVDRAMTPARERDQNVANYHGRLSFDLVGIYNSPDEETETVFRRRLVADQPRHYLFAETDPELLELECAHERVGDPIASERSSDRVPLVPNRLTYFASAPTTPEAELVANWDRGAEWRDWFVTGDRIEVLEEADDEALEIVVQARLAALQARRERRLASPLIRPARVEETDPLARAMSDVSDTAAMLRRLLEIHYPRVIRHHDDIRGLVAGGESLITRDRVRALRDAGIGMLRVPGIGLERLEQLRAHWLKLPIVLREQGQRAPEVDYGLERLEQLMRLSRDERPASGPPEGQ